MSDLVHISRSLTCPGIKANPERDTHDAWESIDFLWTYLSDFGYQHCIYGCIGCLDRMSKDDKKHLPPEPPGNYNSAFTDLHKALDQLPENLYIHLSNISNGDCPACAVLTALQQFSMIARYSENKPVGWEALPCYFEEDIDQRGDYFWNSVRHIDALRNLDLSKLPSRMPPAERRDAKARLVPGKAVVEFIHDFHKKQIQLPPAMSDDELWAVLACSDQIRTLNGNNLFVSPRWKSWAKEGILNGDNGDKGAFVSRVGMVAFDCHRNLQAAREHAHISMWGPEVSEYEVICSILTAAYFYSSGIALSEEGANVWFDKTAQGFIVFERDDFGKRYYGLSGLGRALALRHGGSPPPFLQQEAEKGVGPAPHPTPPPITVTSTDVIDNDNTANSNAQAVALGGDGGKGGDAKVTNAPANNSSSVVEVKEGAVQNNSVVHNHMADPANLADKILEAVKLGREMRGEHSAPIPSYPPLDVDDGENSSANPDRLIEGVVMVVVRGDVEDGDAIFQEAHIALDGARDKTRQITFLDRNKQHDAAKRLLVHLAGTSGKLDMNAIKGICIDAELKDTMAGNVRDQLDKQICDAAGLPTKGKDRPKAFAFNAATKEYITKLSFTIHSTIEE